VLLSRSLVTDGDGRPIFFFNVVDDITERRRAEEALAESEERFRSVAQAAGEAIVLADENGTIVSWNAGAEATFGYRGDEVLGRPLTALMPERFHAAHWAGIERVRGTGHSDLAGQLIELTAVRNNGEEFPVELSLATWQTGRGRFFSGIIRDLTPRRQAEEALARTSAELERRAAELERSNADLQHFAWAASHDLAEPLRVVTGYLELLASRYRGTLDAQADQFIEYTLVAVERMQALISGLLAYSRVGTGDPIRDDVYTGELVRDVLAGLGRSIEDAGATVEVDELPAVRADPTQLGRVFQNLISNAVKFAARDDPSVRVAAAPDDQGWRFSVVDNGIGIPEGDRERIFGMFERLHSRDRYAGSGLGLAICQRIVERHGGQIWVEDAPGGGSAFQFTLPAG
jgi:PAS domain S-box-containing protein